MHEEIILTNIDNKSLTLHFVANIMGANRGTPALKTGVKIISKAPDLASDTNSDWQGFD